MSAKLRSEKIIRDKSGKPVQLKVGSTLEAKLSWLLKINGLPEPVREYRFCERRWRFDFAYPDLMVAIECDGETSHARYHQTSKDALKRNRAVSLGWRVFICTGEMLKTDPMGFIDLLKEVLRVKGAA